MIARWVTILIIVPLLFAGMAWTDHVRWMDSKTNEFLEKCCGEQNCLPAGVFKIDDEGTVSVNGKRLNLHPSAVHKSETVYGWYCWKIGVDECYPPKGSRVIPQEIITKKCVMCVFDEDKTVNF